ncbi:MAG: FG-GAP repeat protein [Proteobacteria bacterium]|nr:FG-GAP repeat protein [Pseudomonadota bacterium]
MKQGQFPEVIQLRDLNGQNGFKLDGENKGDYSGTSVSTAGDINGDGIADLLIGAYYYNNSTGRSYVVFGSSDVGSGGTIALSNLTGANGFKLDGENNKDWSGYFVNEAGDVNGDGIADLLIGAWGYPSDGHKGRSYVVFGSAGVGSGGTLALSSLTGANGFKLDGENNGDYSGTSVSSAGDVNGDGIADLLIGAPNYPGGSLKGCSYVVFGGIGVGSNGTFPLSSLTGANGFKINGENSQDYSGYYLSTAGDINNDGIADLLIDAYRYPGGNAKGRSYVVFGGAGVGSSGAIALSSLSGANGFVLDGENNNDRSGYSASEAGDVNGDGIVDLLIGAPYYPSNNGTGRSYVVFGGAGVGSSGVIALSSLTGANGFKLEGENNLDHSGYSVSAAGDINGDGIADLLIGAPAYPSGNNKGRSYVVFGGAHIGNNGTLALSSLTGANGFKLDGENDKDCSGWSVSGVGDLNGDGIADLLISAPSYPSNNGTGRSYVVFGDAPPVLLQNQLQLFRNQTVLFNTSFLSAYDRNHPNQTLVFFPTNISHGRFEIIDQPGISLSNFTQLQLENSTIQFLHDGSAFAPSYNITVRSNGIAWTGPIAANITFTTATPSIPPIILQNNQLTLSNGQSVVLSGSNLQATESGFNGSQLLFVISDVHNGYFSTTSVGSVKKNLTAFTQSRIESGEIEFVHAGNQQAPGYSVLVTDGRQSTLPSPAKIMFADAPIITQNVLNISRGETITLTPAFLNVTVTDGSTPDQVVLTVSNLQHAVITSNVTNMSVNNFTLAQLQVSQIELTQDGSLITPSYTITARGMASQSSGQSSALVYFSNQGVYAPQLVNNYLTVIQGQATRLSNQYLSAQNPLNDQALDNQTMFYISNIEYGHFSLTTQPRTWITSFSQQQLLENQVQFVQDGSIATPGYQAAVLAFGLQSASLPASIFFTPVESPPSPPLTGSDSGYTTIQKAIISAVVSGTIGILFAVVQACLKRAANRKLLQALGDSKEPYELTVVNPVAKEIARQIKITGFMNHTTNTRMVHFKSAVRTILFELTKQGVALNFDEMDPSIRDGIINEIARQTRKVVLGDKECCRGCLSFFKAQATPKVIEDAASVIAEKVAQSLKNKIASKQIGLELPKLSNSQDTLLARSNTSTSPVSLPLTTATEIRNEEGGAVQLG